MAVEPASLVLRHIRDVEDDVLRQFSCGRDLLDNFLHEDARAYDAHGLTDTTVVFLDGQQNPVAYFSLTADSVRLNDFEQGELGLPFNVPITYYPAVKVTKLAVASGLQSSGIGEALVALISGIVAGAPFAVRLLTVDAVNQPNVMAFYEKVGFLESLADKRGHKNQKSRDTVLMIKDLYQ